MTVPRRGVHDHALFVYGTLLSPDVMRRVSGELPPALPASLPGFVRGNIAGEPYPAIVRSDGSRVEGRLYTRVKPGSLARLDRYEGSLYRRRLVVVDTAEGQRLAHVYALAPACARRFRPVAYNVPVSPP